MNTPRFHYQRLSSLAPGTSPPVFVMLHGFAGDGSAWEPVAEGLRRMGSVLLVDLPGHGENHLPGGPEDCTMEACLGGLEDMLIREKLLGGGVPLWWMGYSMGGRLALYTAIHRPTWVNGLVVESGSPGIQDLAERQARRELDEAMARVILERGMESFVEEWLSNPMFRGLKRLAPQIWTAERNRRLAQNPVGLAASLRGMGTGAMLPLWDRLPEIRVPTLLLAGMEDSPYVSLAGQMAGAIPGAAVELIPHAVHLPHVERPEAFLLQVARFVASHHPLHFPT
ncbi:MAG: 2-succinyl-6-hydroxy-2,4-cyclohexadiene-1-carboxylate synthase [Deltaproteobacteria bacterium]|nr:2-succinyl-6-hydroxy-2,4-cyclohexadiene-1-carboxylate synthase [Deltaproteobacteria bacterium]